MRSLGSIDMGVTSPAANQTAPVVFILLQPPSLKKKEILPFITTRMNVEDIILSEISQTQKKKYLMIPLI